MSLKTSYFNMPLFKSNLKRFWWIGAGVMLGFLTIALLLLFDNGTSEGYAIMNALLIGVAGILPAILFAYLNNSGSVTCLHALPIKRKAHFITNILTIYKLILTPAIIAYGIGFLYCLFEKPFEISNFIEYFPALIVCITIAISAGTLGSMITGNTIAAIAFAILFFTFPFYAEGVLKGFLSSNVHGMWDVQYYSLENMSIQDVNPFMLGWFIVSIIGLIVSWFLYKNRNLETNGDIISFKFLKPIFIGCVSLFAGLVGYFYLCVFFDDSIFLMLPFGILGAVISYMLAKRAFTLKGIWKPVLIYVLFVGLVWSTITFDLTGFERRIPDIDDIESIDMVDVDNFSGNHNYYIIDGKRYYWNMTLENYRYYDKEDFENITKLHARKIDDRFGGAEKVYIVYNLKNGRTLKRTYYVSLIDDKEYLEPIYCTEQKLKLSHNWLVGEYPVREITISDDRMKNDSKTFEILIGDSEKAKLLLDALKMDVKEASYEDIVSNKNSMTQIQLEYQRELRDEDGNIFYDNAKSRPSYDTFGIPENYKRTTALLRQWGLYDAIYKPHEIGYVELEFDYMSDEKVKIEDADTIKELYEFVSNSKYLYEGKRQYDYVYNIRVSFFSTGNKFLFDTHDIRRSTLPTPEIIEIEAKRFSLKHSDMYGNSEKAIVEKASY